MTEVVIKSLLFNSSLKGHLQILCCRHSQENEEAQHGTKSQQGKGRKTLLAQIELNGFGFTNVDSVVDSEVSSLERFAFLKMGMASPSPGLCLPNHPSPLNQWLDMVGWLVVNLAGLLVYENPFYIMGFSFGDLPRINHQAQPPNQPLTKRLVCGFVDIFFLMLQPRQMAS